MKQANVRGSPAAAHRQTADGCSRLLGCHRLLKLHTIAPNESPKFVSMTATLVFRTVTEQGNRITSREALQEAEGEFLTMILDSLASTVDGAIHEELAAVVAKETRPRNPAGQPLLQKAFAGAKRWHPDVVPVRRHSATAKPRGENTEAVAFSIDWTPNRLCPEHIRVPRCPRA